MTIRSSEASGADPGASKRIGRESSQSLSARLDTDQDVDRLLQRCFPAVDDPDARASIIDAFSMRRRFADGWQRVGRPETAASLTVVIPLIFLAIAVTWLWKRRRRAADADWPVRSRRRADGKPAPD